ncbi:uncharacterized protein [Penaeus vannamei]|uniref:uncharacterized protein n=1 Tax=Penaeus vannamei TaxID=6689 RepID=UPI00387F8C97
MNVCLSVTVLKVECVSVRIRMRPPGSRPRRRLRKHTGAAYTTTPGGVLGCKGADAKGAKDREGHLVGLKGRLLRRRASRVSKDFSRFNQCHVGEGNHGDGVGGDDSVGGDDDGSVGDDGSGGDDDDRVGDDGSGDDDDRISDDDGSDCGDEGDDDGNGDDGDYNDDGDGDDGHKKLRTRRSRRGKRPCSSLHFSAGKCCERRKVGN